MLKHKWIDGICLLAVLAAVLLTILLMNGEKLGIQKASAMPGYVHRLFDGSRVHTIDIQMEDWDGFLETALEEAYSPCTVVIDGEVFERVGIRAKGNNSLRLTEKYGLNRYSLKLEFDHYTDGNSYFGLDKFSLDASFQDNSYLKSYLAYDMMRFMEVPSPLCSYVWVTVNGEDWGLFLAVEEPEEAFCRRNFGTDFGQLYKPDYRSLNAENADMALKYVDENPDSYDNIFRNAKFDVSYRDQERLIEALRVLNQEEELERAVNVDEVLRYFTVQVFVMNWDSYIGYTGHNYFLYEEGGQISILPWDYNLAFGTYALGMTNPLKDAEILINYPVFTPAEGSVMKNRPLYHNLMQQEEYFTLYQKYFDQLISEYFESGCFEAWTEKTFQMISPYVEKDPTAFCSYDDFCLAAETLEQVCRLRARSVRQQLDGEIPATLSGQAEHPEKKVDVSSVRLEDLGDFGDL